MGGNLLAVSLGTGRTALAVVAGPSRAIWRERPGHDLMPT